MPAYVIVDIQITSPEQYEVYKELAPSSIKTFGGKYIARGGKTETLEGDWKPNRLVILEFDNADKAKAWLNSSEYSSARTLRHQSARTNMIVVDGI